jgi:glycine cleavage system H protein
VFAPDGLLDVRSSAVSRERYGVGMNVPQDLRYTAEHEWVRVLGDGGTVRVGITDYAQDALGDVVYVDLPSVGDDVVASAAVGELESTKSVSDLYAPVSGSIAAVNEALVDQPQLLNEDPYGDGWLCDIQVSNRAEIDDMMDAAAYAELTEG